MTPFELFQYCAALALGLPIAGVGLSFAVLFVRAAWSAGRK